MDPIETEARAERCARRGELKEAVRLYRSLATTFPDEIRFSSKADALESALQPTEQDLAPDQLPTHRDDFRPATPEQEGERLFGIGDYAGAAAAYRRALIERPDNELAQERLFELYRLARSAPARSPTDAL